MDLEEKLSFAEQRIAEAYVIIGALLLALEEHVEGAIADATHILDAYSDFPDNTAELLPFTPKGKG